MLTLLLGDARLPAGGHAHSGGAEQAVDEGVVADERSLADFLEGRLATAVTVEAHAAARACQAVAGGAREGLGERLDDLDGALDARLLSPAARHASRRQGEQYLRVARRVVPSPGLEALAAGRPDPHLCAALGAAAGGAGLEPEEAAGIVAYHGLAGPASAALRLLGLDPLAVAALLGFLAGPCAELAARAGEEARAGAPLPAPGAPMLDRLMELHHRRKERLFAS